MRDFDFVSFEHDVLVALGGLSADVMSGLPNTCVAGLVATQTSTPSLTINIAAGRIYQFAPADAVADGSIAQDLSVIVQQGYAAAQTITLIPPSAGQSQWNLIQAQFSQVDAVRANDPNGGVVPFYNAANPTQPSYTSINTVRKAVCVLQVISGSAATTGSETPPTPTAGWVPMYLIDIAGGQTQITTAQVLQAGPSVGTGVPSGYPYAPFLAGFLASHHSGTPGQAPKIKLSLGAEVQGVLPYINMSPVRTFLTANLTLYVNASTGNDSNTGLTSALPFKTIQGAVNSIYHNWDFAGFTATVSVANGAFTAGASCINTPPGMNGSIAFVGNVANPAAVTVTVTNGNCFVAAGGALINVSGFTLAATGASINTVIGCGLVASGGAAISFSATTFGACQTSQLYSGFGGNINSGAAAYTITAGGLSHMYCAGGYIGAIGSAVTLTGTPAFSTGFVTSIGSGSYAQVYNMTFAGSATGPRFYVTSLGCILVNGASLTYLPGSTAGNGTGATNPTAAPWGLYY